MSTPGLPMRRASKMISPRRERLPATSFEEQKLMKRDSKLYKMQNSRCHSWRRRWLSMLNLAKLYGHWSKLMILWTRRRNLEARETFSKPWKVLKVDAIINWNPGTKVADSLHRCLGNNIQNTYGEINSRDSITRDTMVWFTSPHTRAVQECLQCSDSFRLRSTDADNPQEARKLVWQFSSWIWLLTSWRRSDGSGWGLDWNEII